MKRVAFYCLFVTLLFGCQEVTSPPPSGQPEIDFTTDSSSYSLSDNETIAITLKNHTDTQYYITEPSFNLTLEKRVDGEWENLGAWYAKAAVVPEPAALGEKNTFPKEVEIGHMSEAVNLEEAYYRFEYILYPDEKASKEHHKKIHTNRFQLTN